MRHSMPSPQVAKSNKALYSDKVVGYCKELTVKFYETKRSSYSRPQVSTYFVEAPTKAALGQEVRAEVAKQEAIPGLISVVVSSQTFVVTKPN